MKITKKISIAILSLTILISGLAFTSPKNNDNNYTQTNVLTPNIADAKASANRGKVYKYFTKKYTVKQLKNPSYLYERQLKAKVIKKYGKLKPVKVQWRVTMIIGRSTMNAIAYKPVSIRPW